MTRFAVDISPPLGDDLAVFGVGDVLRKLRKDRGWTLEELAQASGVSRTTLWELENGKTDTRGSTLKRIAQAFGLDRLPEPSELAPSLELVPRSRPEPHLDPLNPPVHPPSTNQENASPKGASEDDPIETRLRELEDRFQERFDRQQREIQDLRNLFKDSTRAAIKRAESGKARKNQARRGKGDRGSD